MDIETMARACATFRRNFMFCRFYWRPVCNVGYIFLTITLDIIRHISKYSCECIPLAASFLVFWRVHCAPLNAMHANQWHRPVVTEANASHVIVDCLCVSISLKCCVCPSKSINKLSSQHRLWARLFWCTSLSVGWSLRVWHRWWQH